MLYCGIKGNGDFLMKEIIRKIIKSWSATEGNVNSTAQILDWVAALNRDARVSIKECESGDNSFWFYDDYVGRYITENAPSFR